MRSRLRAAALAALLLPGASPAAGQSAVPPHIAGEYFRTHDHGTDTLKVSPRLAVTAKFFFANGHSCAFEGRGIHARDRVIASDEKDECRLVLFFTPGRVHTVTQGECHQWCGTRGSLDRAILIRKK